CVSKRSHERVSGISAGFSAVAGRGHGSGSGNGRQFGRQRTELPNAGPIAARYPIVLGWPLGRGPAHAAAVSDAAGSFHAAWPARRAGASTEETGKGSA